MPDQTPGPMPDHFPAPVAEYAAGRFEPRTLQAVREVPLTIRVNGRELVTLLCTGKTPELLAVGFCRSDGLLDDPGQIVDLRVQDLQDRIEAHLSTRHDPWAGRTVERTITSGCGKGTSFSRTVEAVSRLRLTGGPRVEPAQILALMAELRRRSTLHALTRGCHNSSLCTPERMLVFREDIGRHNAIDMIGGQCLLEGVPTADKLIVSTGRVASEILLKVARMGIGMLVSTSAATSLAVELARQVNLTLVGRTHADGFCVYHSGGRIQGLGQDGGGT